MTRLIREHREPERDRILARLFREQIDHVLGRMRGVRCADGPPPQHGHANLDGMQLDGQVGDGVRQGTRALDRRAVDPILDGHGFKRCARCDRLPHDAMMPSHDVAVLVEPCAHTMHVNRPVIAAFDVVLTGPDHLDRHRLAIGLGNGTGLRNEMCVGDRAPSE